MRIGTALQKMAQLSTVDPAPGGSGRAGHDDDDDDDEEEEEEEEDDDGGNDEDSHESLVFALSNSSLSHPYFSSYNNNSSSSDADAEAAGGTLEWLAPRLSFSRDFAARSIPTAGGAAAAAAAAAESMSPSDKSEESSSDIQHMMPGCCPNNNNSNGSGSPAISNSSCKGGSPSEFEFSKSTVTVIRGQDHSAVHDLQYPCMLAADELFFDGKLRPLYSNDNPPLQNNTKYSVRSIASEDPVLTNWSMKTGLHAYCSDSEDVTMQLYSCHGDHGSAGTTAPEQVSYNYMGYSASNTSGADIMRTELARYPISPKAPTCTSRWKELLGLKKVQIHEYTTTTTTNNNHKHSRSELSSRGTDSIKLMMRKGMRSSDPQLLAPGRRSLDSVTDLKAHVATAAVGVKAAAALEASDSLISAGNSHNHYHHHHHQQRHHHHHHHHHGTGAAVGSISPSALFLCSSSTHDQLYSPSSDPANPMLQPDPQLCPTTSLMMVRQQQQSAQGSSSSSWDMSGSRSSKSSDDSEGMINTMELYDVQKTVNVGIGASVKHRNNSSNSNNVINTAIRARSPGMCEQKQQTICPPREYSSAFVHFNGPAARVTRPGAAKSATASTICNGRDEGLLSASPGRTSVDSRSSGAGKAINCSSSCTLLAAETSDIHSSSSSSAAGADSKNKNVVDTRQQHLKNNQHQHQHQHHVHVRGLDRSYSSPKPLKRRSNHQQVLLKSGGVAAHHGNRQMRSSSSSSSCSGGGACEYLHLHHGSHVLTTSRSLERSTSYSAAAAVRVTPVMYITPGFRKASKINATMFNGLTHLFSSNKKDKPSAEQLH